MWKQSEKLCMNNTSWRSNKYREKIDSSSNWKWLSTEHRTIERFHWCADCNYVTSKMHCKKRRGRSKKIIPIDDNFLSFFPTRWQKQENAKRLLQFERIIRVCNATVLRHQRSILFQKHPLLVCTGRRI